jgi:hypothetical protein
MNVLNGNMSKLEELYNEFEHLPELIDELNIHFAGMDGRKNKDEFSRCLVFFLLGRIYEQKYGEKAVKH